MKVKLTMVFSLIAVGFASSGWSTENAENVNCLDCHKRTTPNVVADWKISKHSSEGITCAHCHGLKHTSSKDVSEVQLPQPSTCAECHEKQVAQFRRGKHALSWAVIR